MTNNKPNPVLGDTGVPAESVESEVTPEYKRVDPRELVVGTNVRTKLHLSQEFKDDIAARGVVEAIEVYPNAEGRYVLARGGQLRTLAAIEVGLARVPVLVWPAPDDEHDKDTRKERIVGQLGENLHRTDMTVADVARAQQQLLDLGLTPRQIARSTSTPLPKVKVLLAVGSSEMATKAAEKYDLDYLQAGAIEEFAADNEVVTALIAAATEHPEQFPHVLQRARDDREELRLIAEEQTRLRDQGIRVLSNDEADDATPLRRLTNSADSDFAQLLTADSHNDCPGRAVHVRAAPRWRRQQSVELELEYYCTDPAAYGHTPIQSRGKVDEVASPLSEEEREAARAERRRVRENNKAWDSATQVRLQWISEQLLARKALPKGADELIAQTIVQRSYSLAKAEDSGHKTACSLLGLAEPPLRYSGKANPITDQLATASPRQMTKLSLAMVIGALEERTGRNSWRNPTSDDSDYLRSLESFGYHLSEVETLALRERNTTEKSSAKNTTEEWDAGLDADTRASELDERANG